MRRPFTILALLLLVFSARADGPERDARGWLPGPTAENAAAVIAGLPEGEMPEIDVPKSILTKVDKPTVLIYFSPTCPHCIAVAPEVEQLAKRLPEHGAQLIWVSSGSGSAGALAGFKERFGLTGTVIHDTDREIVAAIAARSTPSALLLKPGTKKGKVKVADIWYPYLPGYDSLVEARVTGEPFGPFRKGEYIGNNHCGVCHTVEHMSWGMSHHAVAWYTLEKQGKTGDEACDGCHVTGKGQPTGWSGDPESPLVNVGCEACHGPGGPHDGERDDPREACAACHDAKHSIAFTVDKGVPLIDHFAADHLTEEQYTERRRKLYDGALPRELLAFAEGNNVGSAACQECHATEHAAWSMSAHASGMNSLAKDDKRKDPACVRCHATAKKSGPPPSEVAGFYTLDGVGCESCHGPGEAHAAAPSKENIEGLGEDCPVCVIEAVCTSCHTAEWDPLWDLDDKLPMVGHQPK